MMTQQNKNPKTKDKIVTGTVIFLFSEEGLSAAAVVAGDLKLVCSTAISEANSSLVASGVSSTEFLPSLERSNAMTAVDLSDNPLVALILMIAFIIVYFRNVTPLEIIKRQQFRSTQVIQYLVSVVKQSPYGISGVDVTISTTYALLSSRRRHVYVDLTSNCFALSIGLSSFIQ